MDNLTYVLLAIIVSQQVFFYWNQHKIVNKIMSRSFYDYKIACNKTEAKKTVSVMLPDDEEKFLAQEMGRI
jgi:hypothetical protein